MRRRRAPENLALFVYDDAPIVVKFIIASLTWVLEHVSIWGSPQYSPRIRRI